MARDNTLPVAYLEEGPVVHYLPTAHVRELEDAEPHAVMEFAARWWRRAKTLAKSLIVLTLIGGYPTAVIASHNIDDSPIVLNDAQSWAAPHAGVAVHLIARELEGHGWASDKPAWHPQARLTAMPAWQAGIAEALGDHARLMAVLAGNGEAPNSDLAAAARLLPVSHDTDARPRLTAAAEALSRYDGQVARDLASAPERMAALKSEADLFAGWAKTSAAALSTQINRDVAEWPASRGDIEAFYRAKAYAHVAHQMLTVAVVSRPGLMEDEQVRSAIKQAETVWCRAAAEKPLLVSNQPGQGLMTNHLAAMAFYVQEAERASAALATAIETLPERQSPPVPEGGETSAP